MLCEFWCIGKLVVRLARMRARMVTLRDMFGNVLIDVRMLLKCCSVLLDSDRSKVLCVENLNVRCMMSRGM